MKKRGPILIWAASLAAAALFGAVLFYFRIGDRPYGNEFAPEMTVGEARAIGARWRASRDDALGREYARALISAGLYDELIAEIDRRGLFAGDDAAAGLFRAEANLRQGRYEEAIAAARDEVENPYMAFARARAGYALSSNADAVGADLARALRGPKELGAEAWIFRARLALDANDFASAEAAARRAGEAGATKARTGQLAIELALRQGDLQEASSLLKARAARSRAAVDPGDYRLSAMMKLRDGDPKAAVRFADLARQGTAVDDRLRLVAALAKWRAGDDAQAWSLVSAHLAAAPQNWVALDLGAAIARDMRRDDEAAALLTRLAAEKPALAIVRRLRSQPDALDAAFDDLLALNGARDAQGAAAALLGANVEVEGLDEARAPEISLINLAAAIDAGDPRAVRRMAEALSGEDASPLALALAGVAFGAAGDQARADALLIKASAGAPGFLTPVKVRAAAMEREGDVAGAAALLRGFAAMNRNDEQAQLLLAAAEAASGDWERAVETYASIDPAAVFGDARAAAAYGKAAGKTGGDALSDMRRGARLHASSARILGLSLAAADDDEGAAPALKIALIADPADTDVKVAFLGAMTRIGQSGEARSLLAEIGRRQSSPPPDFSSNPQNLPESKAKILQ